MNNEACKQELEAGLKQLMDTAIDEYFSHELK